MSIAANTVPVPGGRLEITPGPGAVLRFGAIIAWVGPSASAALAAYLVREARALAVTPAGGRVLADQVATVLRSGDPEPAAPFAIVGASDGGWGALLHGPVQLWDGATWSAPTPAPGWLGVLLGHPVTIAVGPSGSFVSASSPESPYHLERGVVPGAGFTFTPEPVATPAASAASHAPFTAEATFAPAAPPPAAPPPVTRPPSQPVADRGRATIVDLRLAPAPSRAPLPAVAEPQPPAPGAATVTGVRCPRGHFNHPAATVCLRCRTVLGDADRTPVSGPRLSLGVLIRDDGGVFSLDSGYVLGADPGGDPALSSGAVRPLTLAGDGIAPAHAELGLTGWGLNVADRGSPGGTYVLGPGERQWSKLAPYQARVVAPGTHVACGQRIVTYASPWPG